MDISSPCSDPHSFGSNFWCADLSETSSSSSSPTDEEVILASSRPKRRAGRKKFKETRHPVYRGVRRRNSNKWVCELREPNKKSRIWLGTYPTAEMAARAHDVAALALRGQSACLNFADSVWRLPVPVSNNAKDIKKAAVEAAEVFRPRDEIERENVKATKEDEKSNDSVLYIDEEAVFDMPGLIANMAEGLLLSPPPNALWGGFSKDDVESDAEVSLWSYSF